MKLHLSEAQLLQEWQLRHLPPMINAGCTVNLASGYDMDAILSARMHDWYASLLAAGDMSMLAPVEIGDRLSMTTGHDGTGIIILPENVVRVVTVDMEGWKSPATITRDPLSRIAARQRSPYSRAGTDSPVAVIDGRTMRLYTPPSASARISVTAIVDDPGEYHLDSAALSTIKSFYQEITP